MGSIRSNRPALNPIQTIGSSLACGFLGALYQQHPDLVITEERRIAIATTPPRRISPEGFVLIEIQDGQAVWRRPGERWHGQAIACYFWEDRSAVVAWIDAPEEAAWHWGRRLPEGAILRFHPAPYRLPMRHRGSTTTKLRCAMADDGTNGLRLCAIRNDNGIEPLGDLRGTQAPAEHAGQEDPALPHRAEIETWIAEACLSAIRAAEKPGIRDAHASRFQGWTEDDRIRLSASLTRAMILLEEETWTVDGKIIDLKSIPRNPSSALHASIVAADPWADRPTPRITVTLPSPAGRDKSLVDAATRLVTAMLGDLCPRHLIGWDSNPYQSVRKVWRRGITVAESQSEHRSAHARLHALASEEAGRAEPFRTDNADTAFR